MLGITLTEPVLFLRSSDPSGRLEPDPNDSPTLVRGILALNVPKQTAISSIDVELFGLLTLNIPPEGVPSRHSAEFTEKHKIFSSSISVFRAGHSEKRAASVGPGPVATTYDDDERATTTASYHPTRGRPDRRIAASDLGPTPPYTPVAQPPTPRPVDTIEEPGQPPNNSQAYPNAPFEQLPSPSTHPLSSAHSFSSSTTHSHASEIPDISREDDNIAPASPTLTRETSIHSNDEHHVLSPSHSAHFHSTPSPHESRPCTHTKSHHDSLNAHVGHSRLRLSLSGVLDAIKEATSSRSRSVSGFEGERGRTRARLVAEPHGVGCDQAGETSAAGSQPASHRENHLLGIGRVLGLQRDHEKEKEHTESIEFKPGTYSYPISFLLPPDLPPTFSISRGSLSYFIKAVAHRPGTFTSKLSCRVPLLVISASSAGAGEGSGPGDLGPVSLEKQWEGQLAYSFALSSRLFLLGSQRQLEASNTSDDVRANIGLVGIEAETRPEAVYGTAMLDLTLLPLEKVKIWRLSVFIDQQVRYVEGGKKHSREEDNTRVKLLEVLDMCPADEVPAEHEQTHKHKNKRKDDSVQIPVLPTPVSPHRSPLFQYVSPSSDPSMLAGPGPYSLSIKLGLPDCNRFPHLVHGLHFTIKHKSSLVRVEHTLRLVMRVERTDGDADGGGDKKKYFDIAVQAPITVLSCRCVPEYQVLPRYSPTLEDARLDMAACPCRSHTTDEAGDHSEHSVPFSSSTSLESEEGVRHVCYPSVDEDEVDDENERSRSRSRARRSHLSNPLVTRASYPSSPINQVHGGGASWNRSPGHSQIRSHTAHAHSPVHVMSTLSVAFTPISTPLPSRPPSPVARYERLVSGLESEVGEAPPSYESIASR